jgi:CheY-like chemotaxis protein
MATKVFGERDCAGKSPRRPRVLVVDDNAQIRLLIAAIFKQAGVKGAFFAPDGRTGLAMLASCTPDVVIVDYQMPEMNGLQFVTRLRARETEDRKLPVIMLTGHSEPTRLFQARDRGVTEFLAKPVSPALLLQRIRHVLSTPLPFIEAADYVGPERRRRSAGDTASMKRRVEETMTDDAPYEMLG